MKTTALQLTGQASPEEIKAWKEKFKQGIYQLVVDGHVGYFRNPERAAMTAAMSRASMENPLEMYEVLTMDTFIGGSKHILEDDECFYGVVQSVKVKMDGKKAELVNL